MQMTQIYITGMQIAPFDPTKKKKKKKPVAQELAEDDSVDTLAEKTESLSGTLPNFILVMFQLYIYLVHFVLLLMYYIIPVSDGLETFAGLKKKKKKPVSDILDKFSCDLGIFYAVK